MVLVLNPRISFCGRPTQRIMITVQWVLLCALSLGPGLFSISCDGSFRGKDRGQENILSYTRVDGKLLFRTGEKVFQDDPEGEINTRAKTWDPSLKYPWTKLLNLKKDKGVSARFFSFRSFPKSSDFLFVIETRPALLEGYEATFPAYMVFRYSESQSENRLSYLLSFTKTYRENFYVAKIDQISSDEKCVSFNLFPCWTCVYDQAEKVLLDLESLSVVNIGRVSYFKWKDRREYDYKEYIEKDCYAEDAGYGYKCPEDPSILPLKQGILEIFKDP